MLEIIAVAVGGSLGAVTRFLVSVWAAGRFGAEFPLGTLLANIAGCFIIGLFMTIAADRMLVSPYWRLLVTTGFVGGLTTFSSFSYETFQLLETAQVALAAWNMLLNLGLGFTATWLGIGAARLL